VQQQEVDVFRWPVPDSMFFGGIHGIPITRDLVSSIFIPNLLSPLPKLIYG
jgi:hypothetical protein